MNRYLCKTAKKLAIVMACALVTLGLSACSKDAASGYLPDEGATWGDLCREMDKSWFESQPDEVQATFDALTLGEVPPKEVDEEVHTIHASTPVIAVEQDEQKNIIFVNDYGWLTAEELEREMVELGLLLDEQEGRVDYQALVACEELAPQAAVVVALSDAETGEYLAVKTLDTSIEQMEQLDGSFDGLTSGHEYQVQAISLLTPPDGYTSDGALYAAESVTAK